MAMAAWILIIQGWVVVDDGLRRSVNPHWHRGLGYTRIGWNWMHYALSHEEALIVRCFVPDAEDP